ncbi:glycosyl hydrolase family 28-related protein [Qipengyuania seohaensis]|uniref:glycosyl hydrolase family 28-related protein n=1 Tax=Qipengyuania seohaensis TaxID=266951 RepID=UPI000C2207E9|nr:glycosyl hydrolase family 28-related protein [Qipengyuania seohaensis]
MPQEMVTLLKSSVFFSALAISVATAAPVWAQDLPPIIANASADDENWLPDFSYAGFGVGIEAIPHVASEVRVDDFGARADDEVDDTAAVIAAIAAASEQGGPVRVQFGSGRYILSGILWIEHSGIVLSGMGSGEGGTELYMPRPLNQLDDGGALDELRTYLVENDKRERQKKANLDTLFSPWSWSGGFIWTRVPEGRHATYLESHDRPIGKQADITMGKRGERILTVADGRNLAVGDVLQIHWHNRAGPDGPLIRVLYGNTEEEIGSRHWELPDRPLVRQATKIERIDGNRVTISDPLLHPIGDELPAYFASWEHLSDVGIQDLALAFPENPFFGHHNEAGYNGIYFTGVHDGWIRNVTVTNSDSGILTDDLANVTIANVRTKGDHMAHYSVHIGNVHNVLVDGLTVENPTIHALSFNTQATKSVYKDAVVWSRPSLDQHAGANHQNLYDNVTVHLTPDRKAKDGTPMFDLYKAGGAGYWKPGHARYNTTWNLKVLVDGGVAPGQPVTIFAGSEGPDARIIGLHGNRPLLLDHTPEPHVEWLNKPVANAPSLYEFQRQKRLETAR